MPLPKNLTEEEKDWLEKKLPTIYVEQDQNNLLYLEGLLEIDAYYNLEEDSLIIFPDATLKTKDKYIHDYYLVRITKDSNSFIPDVYNIDGRIQSAAINKNKPACDLHLYSDTGRVCLCPKPQEKLKLQLDYTINEFLEELVIPFFYWQGFYEAHNYEPWKAYSHGDLGILECYGKSLSFQNSNTQFLLETFKALNTDFQKIVMNNWGIQIYRHILCPVCKNKEFRKCHPDAMNGLKQLKSDYNQYMRKQV